MKVFIKENLVLITGIALPLLLTLVFFAATMFDRIVIDPPKHSVIFATHYYYHNNANAPYRLYVKNDKVHFTYTPPNKENDHRNWQKPRLFVYDPIINNTREIELPIVEDPDVKINEVIKEIDAKKITTLQKSPDGYEFEYNYRSNGNLMTELFGGGSRSRSHYALRKGANKVKIHSAERYYYNARFIGWMINDQGASNDQ